MAQTRKQDADDVLESQEVIVDQSAEEAPAEEVRKLDLQVKIDTVSACERHITVTVSRADIEHYFDKEFSELMPAAQIPGFRPGHAPRKLVEHRFRKDVADRVKGALLMDSLAQIHEEQDLSAISEPDLDLAAVQIPESGPLTFEFKLEVRPQFDMPKWKGLKLDKPTRDFSDADVDKAIKRILTGRGRLVPHDGAAEPDDYITTNLTFKHGDQVLSSANEEVIRLRPVLSFRDGKIENFDQQLDGVRAGETRKLEAQLSDEAPNAALRGQKVEANFEILEIKKLETPELDAELLTELGGFTLEADLRDAVKDMLARKMEYEQRRRTREQITQALTVAADWELPHDLLERQSRRELQRAVMELQRSGFSEQEIVAHENLLRQNSQQSTARALKEHFILERIAEDQNIEADEQDYNHEIGLIAAQSNESPRRVRARLEKNNSMDVLRNQIIERKVIDLILESAEFKNVPYEIEESDVAAIEVSAGGGDHSDIPEAKPGAESSHGGKPDEARQHG